MTWTIKSFIFLFILISLPSTLVKADSLSLFSDSFGNTYGSIGNNSVNTYSDSFGSTYGSIGNNSVNTYSDSFGNTYGSIWGN